MLIRHPNSALYETPKVASETDVCEATARAIFGALARPTPGEPRRQ